MPNTGVVTWKSHGGLTAMAAVTKELEVELARYLRTKAPPREKPIRNILSVGCLSRTAQMAA